MVHSANKSPLFDLSQLPDAERYFIAYSGGIDSTALLHGLIHNDVIDNTKITAIHINHNINPDAANWAKHCDDFCKNLDVKLITVSVKVNGISEDACRQARLAVYRQKLNSKDCLITGHHLNDQVETVLFRLLRGTGLHGLTGISELTKQANYQAFRPMLTAHKQAICAYVERHQLDYVVDPSNHDNHYSRNFIRNQVLPLITERYHNAFNNIDLTRNNLSKSLDLLNLLINNGNPLNISQFSKAETLTTVLYHWLTQYNITASSHRALEQFATDCINCAIDKMPQLTMSDWQLICWQSKVYLLNTVEYRCNDDLELYINSQQKTELPGGLGAIKICSNIEFTIQATIKFAQNDEKIKLTGHQHRHKVKNLFQTNQIPPWERAIIPYLYIDGELMAVGSYFIAEHFSEILNKYNAEYQWLSPQFLL